MKTIKKFSPKYRESILTTESNIKDALNILSKSGLMIVCIVPKNSLKLIGVITDSDIRKALLKGATLESSVESCINKNPVSAHTNLSSEELSSISHDLGKREIPLIDDENEIDDIFVLGLYDVRLSEESYHDHFSVVGRKGGQSVLPLQNYIFIFSPVLP